jgi:hypothetical protein
VLISISEAAAVLGLKSRGSVYRKIRNGELATVLGPDGSELIEREGLEERWGRITRTRMDSPKPRAARQKAAAQVQEVVEQKPVQRRVERKRVMVVDQPPESMPAGRIGDDELPEYNESRKRSEFERANLLELERKQKEGLLLPAEQVQKVWANSVAIVKTKLLAVPSRLRQRIPHLTLEEIAIAEELIRESLEELSEGQADGE